MRRTKRLCMGAAVCLLMAFAPPAMPQAASALVDTGVIFSAKQVERSRTMNRLLGAVRPLWTPSPGEVARLESKLKAYLEDVADGRRTEVASYWRAPSQAKEIVARLASYKRQYFGFTRDGRKWILVNGFCEAHWKEDVSWKHRMVVVMDGGACFFTVHYDPASQRSTS